MIGNSKNLRPWDKTSRDIFGSWIASFNCIMESSQNVDILRGSMKYIKLRRFYGHLNHNNHGQKSTFWLPLFQCFQFHWVVYRSRSFIFSYKVWVWMFRVRVRRWDEVWRWRGTPVKCWQTTYWLSFISRYKSPLPWCLWKDLKITMSKYQNLSERDLFLGGPSRMIF